MSTTPQRWVAVMFGLAMLAAFGSGVIAEEYQTKGLQVGDLVPISSMRCVVGTPTDRNTCLAGKYRKFRTISIYARSLEEPQLDNLLKKVEGMLEKDAELRSYVLLLEGSQFNNEFKDEVRDWMKQQGLARLDIAIANGDPAKTFGLAKEAEVVVVYSEKLRVRYHRDIAKGKIDEATVEEAAAELSKLME